MYNICEGNLNNSQNIHSRMVGACGTLHNSTYFKTSKCFKWKIFTLSLLLANYPILVFSIFDTFVLPSKFEYFGKALDASEVGLSDRITAGWSIWKSNFPQNVTSNVIFNLPEGQPTQCATFSIFEIFVLPVKIFMPQ